MVISENTHEPLVTEEIASIIKPNKEKGLWNSLYNKKNYPLTDILKSGVCVANFTGESGYCRFNSKRDIGNRCGSNSIVQGIIEQALTALLIQVVFEGKQHGKGH